MMTGMRTFDLRIRFCWLATLFMAFACNMPGIATPTPTPSVTPSATPTVTPTPTPTPSPRQVVQEAERALFFGDWDLALSEYQSVAASEVDPRDRLAALVGIGETLVSAGRFGEAIEALSGFIATSPRDALLAKAHFLRAQAYHAIGDFERAIEDYQDYLTLQPGVIDSYVEEWVGDDLRQVGRPLEAVQRYQAAIDAPRLGSVQNLRVKMGLARLEAGDYLNAIAVFDEVQQLAGDPATKATMNLLVGRALEAQGDLDGAYGRYLDSVQNYPQAYDSYNGLITLVEAGVAVDQFQRGLVDYHAGAYDPALRAFNGFLDATPTGTGYYYRGLTKRALGDALGAVDDLRTVITSFPDDPTWSDAWFEKARTEWLFLDQYGEAVQTYLDFVTSSPASPDAPQALFSAGRVAERDGELALAAEVWSRLPTEYPASEFAHQGAFLAGVARYRLDDREAARASFLQAEAFAVEPGQRAASQLWLGKIYQAQGDRAAAENAWRVAAEADPTGYYSARAADLLRGWSPFHLTSAVDLLVDLESERREAEEWMRATFPLRGPEPLSQLDPSLANDLRMIRAEELWRLGLKGQAAGELEALRKAIEGDAEATYRLMHKLLEMGLYRPAIFAARQILHLAGMDDAATMKAPVYFNHIRFGPYFEEIIFPEADAAGLDRLFLLSLVRQESLFEGFATSSSAARGLMQVIPTTGQEIANQLGWPPGYTTEDLYRPVVSVRFGTHYLATQRDQFDGDLYAALAAYNAGPGNASIWKQLAPEDPDLFLEVVRFEQTHLYIRRIYEIFSIYRDLYARP